MKTKGLGNRIWPLIFLSCALSIGNILYIPVIFYTPFQTVFGLTNAQIGNLTAAYASIAVPGYLVGGWVSDRFNAKNLMLISVFSTTLLIIWMATIPSYNVLLFIFFLMSISLGLLIWTSSEKLKRLLGDNSEQGRIAGIAAAIDGVITFVMMVGLSAILGDSLATVNGMRILLLSLAAFYFISGTGLLFGYDFKKFSSLYAVEGDSKVELKLMLKAAKLPVTWIIAIMCFGVYVTSTVLNYLNPYLTTVYAMPVAFASAYSALHRYGFKIIATPIGGAVRDKIGNTQKVIMSTMLPAMLLVIIMMLIPKTPNLLSLVVIVSLLIVFVYRIGNGLTMVPLAELGVPGNMLGTVIGMSFLFGYCSDWFLPSIIGKLIDVFAADAYYYIFGISIVGMSLYILGSLLLKKEVNKLNKMKAN